MATMKSFVGLGRAMWDDPDRAEGNRVGRTLVHVYQHKATGRFHVILAEDSHLRPAPLFRAKKKHLILFADSLPG